MISKRSSKRNEQNGKVIVNMYETKSIKYPVSCAIKKVLINNNSQNLIIENFLGDS